MRKRGGLLLAALLAAAGCGAAGAPRPPESAAPAPATSPAPGVDPSRCGVAFLPAYQGERLWTNLRGLGVAWVRIDLWIGDARHEARFRPLIERAIDEGYGVWITTYHRDPANTDPARLAGSSRGGIPAREAARYQALLRNHVQPFAERIRRSGRNPSERLVIQIENEVAPSDIAPPNPNRFWHGTSAEYFEHLARSYEAVKAVDPGIPVALAGFPSEGLEWAISPSPSPGGRAAAQWMERMLREGRYDLADVHLYHRVEQVPAKIAWVRARTDRPIAATEVAGPDERSGAAYSDAANAQDLSARIPAVLSAGATHVFWLGMAEAPTSDRLGQTAALTRTDAGLKPSYEAYRRLLGGGRR